METTLTRAYDIIAREAESKWDETVPASELSFNSFNSIQIAKGLWTPVLPTAQTLIASRLHIPIEYLRRCPTELQRENLNYWLSTLEDRPMFLRHNDRGVRALFSDRYKPINHIDIMNKLRNKLYPDSKVEMHHTDQILSINVLEAQSQSFFVDNSTTILPGYNFTNSEVGTSSYQTAVFFRRLECTNGMIVTAETDYAIRHVKLHALENFDESMDVVRKSFFNRKQLISTATARKVQDPLSTIQSLARQFGHTEAEASMIYDTYLAEPNTAIWGTMWGVIQAFTATAKSQYITIDQAAAFQRTGGSILELLK